MSLSSLIVQREVATIRQVEEALARQVLYGGDLVTNVLEVVQVPEAALMPLVAEMYRLPQAPVGPLPPSSPEARALVPQDIAVRRSLFPLELTNHKTPGGPVLTIAVVEPLEADALEELAFALGVRVEQRVASLVRIREALSAAYGAPLDRRMTRLLGRLAGVEMGGSGSLPPLLHTGPSVSTLPVSIPDAPLVPRKVTPKPGSIDAMRLDARRTHAGFPAPAPPSEDATERTPDVAAVPEETPSVIIRASVILGPPVPEPLAGTEPTRSPTPSGAPPPTSPSFPPASSTARRSSAPPATHPSSLVHLVKLANASTPAGRRRRGPITLERAKVELEQASERNALLDLFFDFSLQFFEYTALFIVHGDLAEGRDAYGPGATRHKVVGIGVPLDLPSALSAARDRSAPIIARPTKEGLDAVLVHDLDRTLDWPILIVPVVVRGRTVALLYGDNGESGVDGTGSGEVTAFALRVGQAFERVIVRRKLGGFSGEKATPAARVDPRRVGTKASQPPRVVRTAEERAATLSKALGPGGLVRPSSIPPPPTTEPDAKPPVPASGEPMRMAASVEPPSTASARDESPVAPAVALDRVDSPGAPPAQARDEPSEGTREPVDGVAEHDDVVLPLSNRRTIRDAIPRFPESPEDDALRVADEFSETPPPPQVARVRDLSQPPIPREDPPALSLDLTPAPLLRPLERAAIEVPRTESKAPPTLVNPTPPDAVDVTAYAHTDEHELLREIDALTPDSDRSHQPDENAPSSLPSEGGGPPQSSTGKAPPSQAVAVAAHRPPSARGKSPDSLPSVIVDVDLVFSALVDRLAKDPTDEHAEAELLRQGQYAMPAIMVKFPGPILLSLAEIEDKKARVGECGPILRLIAGQRRVALPFVLNEVDSPNGDRRFWATFLLTELGYPEAAPAIVARLFDDEERTRKVARLAARVVAESARETLVEELDRVVRDPRATVQERIATMDTLGELRDAAVVPVLLGSLGDDNEEVAVAARRALSVVARQDFGRDTRRWLAWWSGASSRHRIEWLIDALTHEQPATRKAAAQELKALTREYFGYYEDLPKRERERAQQRYRDWWRSEGRSRFRRA
jgi:hypothetical protein